jgi:hypothetical protein
MNSSDNQAGASAPLQIFVEDDAPAKVRAALEAAQADGKVVLSIGHSDGLLDNRRRGLAVRMRLSLAALAVATPATPGTVTRGVYSEDEGLTFSLAAGEGSKSKQRNIGPIVSTRMRHDEQARRQLRAAKSRR